MYVTHHLHFSLLEVVNENNVLYLVFEFLTMDLKKYLDSIKERSMDPKLLKVLLPNYCICLSLV